MKELTLLQNKGTYFLCLFLPNSKKIKIGKIGDIFFETGYYLYVGKAFGPGGLKGRIKRHLLKNTKKRWHIDYLKSHCKIVYAGIFEDIDIECLIANTFKEKFISIKNFGSSDCNCFSHLFYSNGEKEFFEVIKKAGYNPRILFNIN